MLSRGSLNVTAMVAVLALALTTVIGGVVLAPRAEADPLTPVVTFGASPDGPKGVLAGEDETVRLSVTNPSDDPWYNLSLSLVVPEGVEFASAPDLGAPKVYRSGEKLPDGSTVPAGQDLWVWQDVSDLPGTASRDFDITVKPAQPARGQGETDDTTVFPVGSTIDMTANAYTSTNARYVPVFPGGTSKIRPEAVDATLTGSPVTSTTEVKPFRITKDEPSPESELLRGVHDRPTTYTLTVQNTSEGPTTGAVVTDYLPAGLEFLGCGEIDNTADGREEYEGSGGLDATPLVADCVEATSVVTVEKNAGNAADFPADLADGVYTRVVWGPLDLAAGETLSIVYAAGIPQKMNTMEWADGVDVDALGDTGQAANLDNNSGATTRHSADDAAATDGDVYRNLAALTGTYDGVVRTETDRESSDSDDETVYSMDVRVLKSVDTQPTNGDPTPFAPGSVGTFVTGSIAKYTLNVSTSEYVDASDIALVDVIPNGLCPVLPAGVTVLEGAVQVPQLDGTTRTFTGAAAADFPEDCIPGATSHAGGWTDPEVSGADIVGVAYDPVEGRFVLSLSIPGTLAAVESHDVVYPVLMRGSYAGEEGTTSSLDNFTNTVAMTATTTGLYGDEQGEVTTVADDSSATIVAGPSSISKKVLPRDALAGETVCPADPSLYVEGDDPAASGDLTFAFGDTVCYELTVTFAADADTRNPVITDMLPDGLTFGGWDATLYRGASEEPDVTWNGPARVGAETLRWKPATHVAGNTDRLVPLGSHAVIHVWGTVDAVSEKAGSLDKPQNLMKYQQENVRGELFFLRDQADILVDAGLQLVKGVRDVDGDARLEARTQQDVDGAVFGSNRDGIEVVEGSEVTYRIDLSGAPQDVSGLEVWDKLPAGISVADVSDISPVGTVEERGDGVYIVWTGLTVAKDAESTLTYTVTIPDETAVASALVNTASIREYVLDTNTGTPSEIVRPGDEGIPTTGTSDSSDVYLPDVTVAKRVVSTEVDDAGNNGSGSPVPPATTPLPQAVHGEYITYEYSVTVPAHTSVLEGVLKDSGLVSGTTAVTSVIDPAHSVWTLDDADPSTVPGFAEFDFDASTGVLTFPQAYDNTTDDPQTFAVQVTLYVVGQVPPADAVLGQGDRLDNTATFTSTTGDHDASAAAEYVVPEPVVTKTVDNDGEPVTADQVLTYTLTATNTTGRPTSFGTVVTDCVPAALVNVRPTWATQGSVKTSLRACADGGTEIVWTVGDLAAGEPQALTYTATVSTDAAGGVSYTNTADLVGYVLAGMAPTDPRQLELTSSDEATVTVQDATIVKTVDAPRGSVGDVRDFSVTVTLPKNVNFYSPVVTDEVPQGLKVDPTSVRIEAPGTGVTFGCDPTTGPGTDGGDIVCTADGDITSSSEDRTITLTYSATVVQDASQATPVRGAALTNTAEFSWAQAPGSTERQHVDDDATVTVTEPGLTIIKRVQGEDAQDDAHAVPAEPSSTLRYSIEVTNPATTDAATAYDVVVTDAIPAGLVDVVPVDTPAGVTYDPDATSWTIPSIAPGASVELTFTARLEDSPELGGGTITNTAEITEYWSTPAPADGDADDEHRRYVGGSDPAVVQPVFPFVSVVKTVVDDGRTAEVGTPFPWVLTITNGGGGLAKTVTATDTLPVGWDSPVVTAVTRNGVDMDPADWDFDADEVRWTFRDVAADDVIVVGYTTVPRAAAYTAPGAGVGPSPTGPDNPHTNEVELTATDSTGLQDRNADGVFVGAPDSADAFLRATNVSVTKERVGTDRVWTGDEVTFTLRATNEGPQAADDVTIEDTLPAGLTFADVADPVTYDPAVWSCTVTDETVSCVAVGPLAAGTSESVSVRARALPPTVGEVSEEVVNTATVSTSTPETDVTDNTDTEPVTVWATPSITIDKRADVAKAAIAGGDDDTQYVLDGQDPAHVAHFSITVTNTGPVALTEVEVVDELAPQCGTVAIPDLAPAGETGDSYTFTCDGPAPGALGYTNTATVTAESANGDAVDATDTSRAELSAIDLVKTGAIAPVAPVPGDLVTFDFVVTNTGSSTLTGVEITDELPGISAITFGDWPGDPGTLTAGQSVTATATYALTLADVDAGKVTNAATTTGTDPAGQVPADEDTVTVVPGNAPSIDLVKTGELLVDPDEEGKAGDTVRYTFVVTNTGNVTLDDVAVSDALSGLGELTYDWSGAVGVGTLAPQQVVRATADYVLTQADVDAGRVDNTATVEGVAPDGSTVDDDDSWVVPIVPQPLVHLVKTGALADGSAGRAGDVVEYTFTVTNPGSVTLTDVSISDLLTGLSDITYEWPGAEGVVGVVAPGQEVVARATYTLTQEDVDRGSVDNTATVEGTPPTGGPVEDDDTTTVVVPPLPEISLVKTGVLEDGAQGLLGDTVEYTFTATNTGNVTLHDVAISDVSLPGLSDVTPGDWPGAPGVLAPGQSIEATASYDLTQPDIELGYVDNHATTTGTSPGGAGVDGEDDERVATLQTPVVVLEKVASLASGQDGRVGDVVEYGFTVRNDGNVTLTGVEISDPMPGLSELVYTWPGTAGVLLPGEEATATAEYVLTQQDVDRGSVDNTADVVGTAPGGKQVTDQDEASVPLPQDPSVALTKTAELVDGAAGVAGDTVAYTFEVTNTGDVTLSGVRITDPLEGVSEIVFGTWPGEVGELAPGASVVASATYVLTQADVDAGSVTNVATVTGTPQVGQPVTDDDTVTVPTTQRPAIDLVKTGVVAGGNAEYSFTVTNTGTVTLTDVVISDPLEGLSEVTYGAWPATAGTLAPGESVTASATLVLTPDHLAAGSVVNSATATGTAPSGDVVTATDEVTLTTPPASTDGGDDGDGGGTTPPGGGTTPPDSGTTPPDGGMGTGPGDLARTGAAVLGLGLLAAALVAGGLLLVRRRNRPDA